MYIYACSVYTAMLADLIVYRKESSYTHITQGHLIFKLSHTYQSKAMCKKKLCSASLQRLWVEPLNKKHMFVIRCIFFITSNDRHMCLLMVLLLS